MNTYILTLNTKLNFNGFEIQADNLMQAREVMTDYILQGWSIQNIVYNNEVIF